VAGRNVAVGYNDSQQSLLFTAQGTSLSGYSWSRDGGRTFTDGGPLPDRPGYVNLGDPWMTSDRAGRMYYATLAATPNFNLGVSVARSTDGGRTWTVAYAARHSLAEDCSVTQYLGAQPIVDPANGTLYVAAERFQVDDPQCQGAELVTSEVIFKSTDGGRTFGPAVKIADITPAGTAETAAGPAILLGPGKAMRTAEFPVLAFHRNTLYVAWNEARGGHSHLRLASSSNAGASWSLRWLTGGNADEAQPALSGDREGLHVLYYSIAPTRPNRLIDVAVLDSRGWQHLPGPWCYQPFLPRRAQHPAVRSPDRPLLHGRLPGECQRRRPPVLRLGGQPRPGPQLAVPQRAPRPQRVFRQTLGPTFGRPADPAPAGRPHCR
jgi:hypothetical protein